MKHKLCLRKVNVNFFMKFCKSNFILFQQSSVESCKIIVILFGSILPNLQGH